MRALTTGARNYLRNQAIKQSLLSALFSPITHNPNRSPYRHLTRRTLILETQQSDCVKLEKLADTSPGILEVILDRKEAKNAISRDMLYGLRRVFELVDSDSSAKVVLLRSSLPKVFCAGADLKERRQMSASEVLEFVNTLRSTFSFIEELSIPSIAVIEGVALGGGLEMAMSCDLRVCGEGAVLGLPETGLAIIPGAGGTQRLPRLVGKALAKELIYTGRKLTSEEAKSIGSILVLGENFLNCRFAGLVNHSVAAGGAHSKALEIAREIAEKGPIGIRMAKRAIDEGFERDMAGGMEVEEECYGEILHTRDRLEGLAAFAEKRKPIYNGE